MSLWQNLDHIPFALLPFLRQQRRIIIMSDLAPFVAAHIRDKVVEDLQEEVEALKKENRLLRKFKLGSIKITGPAGSPVYVRERLCPEKRSLTAYCFYNLKRECPLSSLFGLEMQLNGTDVFELAQADCSLRQRELHVNFQDICGFKLWEKDRWILLRRRFERARPPKNEKDGSFQKRVEISRLSSST